MTLSESKSDKQTVQYSGNEEYLVIADAKDPSFADVLADATSWANLGNRPLPQIDDSATVNGVSLFVTSRELSYYEENERAVLVKVKYDAKKPEESTPEPPEGTDAETWQRITVQSESMTKPAVGWATFGDIPEENVGEAGGEGSPPVNSAGDPVEGIEEDVALVRLTYTNTQVASPNFGELLRYTNRCNDADFLGAQRYTVRVTGWSAEYDQKNNVWSVSLEFKYNPNGWFVTFPDAGLNEVDGTKRKAILDYYGNPVGTPVPLDGSGSAVVADYYTSTGGPGGGQAGGGVAVLPELYLYPYKKANLSAIFANCGI